MMAQKKEEMSLKRCLARMDDVDASRKGSADYGCVVFLGCLDGIMDRHHLVGRLLRREE